IEMAVRSVSQRGDHHSDSHSVCESDAQHSETRLPHRNQILVRANRADADQREYEGPDELSDELLGEFIHGHRKREDFTESEWRQSKKQAHTHALRTRTPQHRGKN